jgi:hypothetical protein
MPAQDGVHDERIIGVADFSQRFCVHSIRFVFKISDAGLAARAPR